jgi:hypothetical protein
LIAALGYDKVNQPEEEAAAEGENEEGDNEEGAAATETTEEKKPEISEYAEKTFDLVANGKEEFDISEVFSTLNICKTGYGEAAFRYSLKAVDEEGAGALKEPALWAAITRSANEPLDAVVRNHLRKAVSDLPRQGIRIFRICERAVSLWSMSVRAVSSSR